MQLPPLPERPKNLRADWRGMLAFVLVGFCVFVVGVAWAAVLGFVPAGWVR